MRKLVPVLAVAGMIAAGTASATSLGDNFDLTLSAADIDLEVCTTDDVDIIPAAPDLTTAASDVVYNTFTLGTLQLDGLACVLDGKVMDISFIGASEIAGSDAVGEELLDYVLTITPPSCPVGQDLADLVPVGGDGDFDACVVLVGAVPTATGDFVAGSSVCDVAGVAPEDCTGTYPNPDHVAAVAPSTVDDAVLLVLTGLPAAATTDMTALGGATQALVDAIDLELVNRIEVVVYDTNPAPTT